ncbi:MAG TPA: hypothetical protein PKY63_07510 [Bacteroidales bacterium]|nr:hypothetical protein [Bacteroidales bacterium]
MKKILFGLCLLFFAAAVQAQVAGSTQKLDVSKWKQFRYLGEEYWKDSLYIFSRNAWITIKCYDLGFLADPNMQMSLLLDSVQQHYSTKSNYYDKTQRFKLRYYNPGFLVMEQLDSTKKTVYSEKRQSIIPYPELNECRIDIPGGFINIRFYNDSVLLSPMLKALITDVIALKSQKDWHRASEVRATNIDYSDSTFRADKKPYIIYSRKKMDEKIVLNLSSGLCLSKAPYSLSAEVKLGYIWNNFDYDIGYYLSYDWNFSFAENGTRSINSFINLSALEEGFLPRLKTMAGIDMGYLVFRQGDVFEKNTFRLGFGFKGDFWYFSPQMYFPGKFKGVYPGLRLLIGI